MRGLHFAKLFLIEQTDDLEGRPIPASLVLMTEVDAPLRRHLDELRRGYGTVVSIMSSNGVPIQDISDTVGHKSTHVTETVYRHVIVPAIRGERP